MDSRVEFEYFLSSTAKRSPKQLKQMVTSFKTTKKNEISPMGNIEILNLFENVSFALFFQAKNFTVAAMLKVLTRKPVWRGWTSASSQ